MSVSIFVYICMCIKTGVRDFAHHHHQYLNLHPSICPSGCLSLSIFLSGMMQYVPALVFLLVICIPWTVICQEVRSYFILDLSSYDMSLLKVWASFMCKGHFLNPLISFCMLYMSSNPKENQSKLIENCYFLPEKKKPLYFNVS